MKRNLNAVTNLQGALALEEAPVVQVELHVVLFENEYLYRAAQLGMALLWEDGRPEWMRR